MLKIREIKNPLACPPKFFKNFGGLEKEIRL